MVPSKWVYIPAMKETGDMVHQAVERIHGLFNNTTARKVLLKLRIPLFLAALVLLVPNIKPGLFLPGFLVTIFGSLFQSWCFGSLDKNKSLAIQGPYALVRNPMYLGRFFLLFGCLLLVGNIWILLIFTILYYFYMANRVKREEEHLKGIFGGDYNMYCREVHRFIPTLKGTYLKNIWFFKWDLFFQNHGHWNFLAVLASYGVFWAFTFVFLPAL
jgi:protein-S-isoprenylcysteine O-methyltransferase Ste14